MKESTAHIQHRVIERAAKLFGRMLMDGKCDNGDKSEVGAIGMALGMTLNHRLMSSPDYETNVGKLLEGIRHAMLNEMTRSKYSHLHVDYGPDHQLGEICKKIGIPAGSFAWPIKSGISIDADSVQVRHGYGSPTEYHYPLSRERWLVTHLSGPDIASIIEWVETGAAPKFRIED